MQPRVILLAGLATSFACGPETKPGFSGDYEVTAATTSCRHDHPDAPSFLASIAVDDLHIEEDEAGQFPLELPMPPCPLVGTIEADEIRLVGDDCVVEIEATQWADAHAIEYTAPWGTGRWEGHRLMIHTEVERRYLAIPNDLLPDWWDGPGSCSASYTLEPLQ